MATLEKADQSGELYRVGPGDEHLYSLQILRGLAACSVLFYHVGFISTLRNGRNFLGGFFSEGHLGVDVFFVLSGFIIFHIHRNDFEKPVLCPTYLRKRFFRVYPLLFTLTLVKLVYMFALGKGVHIAKFDPTVIVSSFLLLPLPTGAGHIINVAWTLCHELLFYGIFAAGILFSGKILSSLLSLWAFLIIVVNIWVGSLLQGLAGFVLNPHNLEFIMGCVIALLYSKLHPRLILTYLALVGALAGLIAGIVFLHQGHIVPELLLRLYWSTVFGLLILASAMAERAGWNFGGWPALVRLGDASYSIYLSHTAILTPLILMFAQRFPVMGMSFQVALGFSALTALAASIGIYYLLERPLLRYFKEQRLPASPKNISDRLSASASGL